jgi:hypothetical protein
VLDILVELVHLSMELAVVENSAAFVQLEVDSLDSVEKDLQLKLGWVEADQHMEMVLKLKSVEFALVDLAK